MYANTINVRKNKIPILHSILKIIKQIHTHTIQDKRNSFKAFPPIFYIDSDYNTVIIIIGLGLYLPWQRSVLRTTHFSVVRVQREFCAHFVRKQSKNCNTVKKMKFERQTQQSELKFADSTGKVERLSLEFAAKCKILFYLNRFVVVACSIFLLVRVFEKSFFK